MPTADFTPRRALQKLLDAARRLDIGDNPVPEALYEPASARIQIWATPDDHPDDPAYVQVRMDAGAFTKPCVLVGAVSWDWTETPDAASALPALELETWPYDLVNAGLIEADEHQNRPSDLAWLQAKVEFLCAAAGIPDRPTFRVAQPPTPVHRPEPRCAPKWAAARLPDLSKVYVGEEPPDGDGTMVFVERPERPPVLLPVVQEDRPYAAQQPGIFTWGYKGTGVRHLALSILADYFGERPSQAQLDRGLARCSHYRMAFKDEVLSRLEQHSGFRLTAIQIEAWLRTQEPPVIDEAD